MDVEIKILLLHSGNRALVAFTVSSQFTNWNIGDILSVPPFVIR
jgi:hypothetical protein